MTHKIAIAALISGAVLMSMEIAAGRSLAVLLGDSIVVWGALIGVILIALSAGYHFGGVLADKRNNVRTLAIILAIGGAAVGLIPLAFALAGSVGNLGLISASLLTCSLLIPASFLLGMVNPYCVRLQAKSITHIGVLSGNISAMSALGSVLGTFTTAFFLVLVLPTWKIFLSLGLICLLLSLFLVHRLKTMAIVALAGGLFLTLWSTHQQVAENVNFTRESLYGPVHVWDDEGIRRISVSGGKMSAMVLSDHMAVIPAWQYIGCLDAAMIVNPEIENAFTIGIGGGLHQRRLSRIYDVDVSAVDINPTVVELSRDYFDLAGDENIELHAGDGRRELSRDDSLYDLISLDVVQYNNYTYRMPFHLATREFFTVAKEHLREGGVLVDHVLSGRENEFLWSVEKTLADSFDTVYALDCNGSQILIATDLPRLDQTQLAQRDINGLAARFYNIGAANGTLLTDEFAPINPFAEAFVD